MTSATSGRAGVLALLILAGLSALGLRVLPRADAVFAETGVRFQGNDASYHLRLVEHQIEHLPRRVTHDPYLLFPGGERNLVGPLFDASVVLLARALGGPSPSQKTVDLVAAWTPAVLGALAVLPIFALGRRAYGSRAAGVAVGLVAVLPGPFFDRTVLGFADHHALEVFFALVLLATLAAATETSGGRPRTVRAVAAGGCLTAYLLSWSGGAMGIGLLIAWSAGVALWGRETDSRRAAPVAATAATGALLALAGARGVFGPLPRLGIQVAGLVLWTVVPAVLRLVRLRAERHTRPRVVATGVASAGALVAGALAVGLRPDLPAIVTGELGRFFDPGQLVAEARPLLHAFGSFSARGAWTLFGPAFFLFLPALAHLFRPGKRRGSVELLVGAFAGGALLATLGQVRFGLYLTPAMALVLGRAGSVLIDAAGADLLHRRLAGAIVALLLFWPGVVASARSSGRDSGPGPGWTEALEWLRHETPDPFGAPETYTAPAPGLATARGSYGVLAAWEHGYRIVRDGRRIPVANPRQSGVVGAAALWLETSPARALASLRRWGVRYVVVDQNLMVRPIAGTGRVRGGLDDALSWTGRPRSDAFRARGLPGRENKQILVYGAAYYRSLAARLYLHGGQAVGPATTDDRRPNLPACSDPARSCVPLDRTRGLSEVFRSEVRGSGELAHLPAVRIFEVAEPAPDEGLPAEPRGADSRTRPTPDRRFGRVGRRRRQRGRRVGTIEGRPRRWPRPDTGHHEETRRRGGLAVSGAAGRWRLSRPRSSRPPHPPFSEGSSTSA